VRHAGGIGGDDGREDFAERTASVTLTGSGALTNASVTVNSAPSWIITGQGYVGATPGLQIQGFGANFDFNLNNKNGSSVCAVVTGTQTFSCNTMSITTPLGASSGGTGINSLGTGVPAWLGTPSSANLRAAVTDETGTGLLYFQGGDIGTPSAGVATNLTGTAASLTAGNATKLATARAIGIGGSTGLTATGVNFDGTAAVNPALTGTLAVANGGAGLTAPIYGAFYLSSNQSHTSVSGAPVKVALDTAETNSGLTFDGVTNHRVTIGTAGRYLVAYQGYSIQGTAGDLIGAQVKKERHDRQCHCSCACGSGCDDSSLWRRIKGRQSRGFRLP
jgi:hypothetical protein